MKKFAKRSLLVSWGYLLSIMIALVLGFFGNDLVHWWVPASAGVGALMGFFSMAYLMITTKNPNPWWIASRGRREIHYLSN